MRFKVFLKTLFTSVLLVFFVLSNAQASEAKSFVKRSLDADVAHVVDIGSGSFEFAESEEDFVGDYPEDELLRAATLGRFGALAKVDYPHVSGNEASVHASWELKWGSAPRLSTRAQLFKRESYGWVERSSAFAIIWPSNIGGATRRGKSAVARSACRGNAASQWYGKASVFAPGHQKPKGEDYSKTVQLRCG